MVESPSSAVEVGVADRFEEVVQLRLSTLEARADAEATSVKEHFLEQQQFITFSLSRLSETQRTEWRAELDARMRHVDQRFDTMERRLDGVERRLDGMERRLDGMEQRLDSLEGKMDAHHEAIRLILRDILNRLPSTPA